MLCYLAVLAALIWEWAGGTAPFLAPPLERGPGFGHKRLSVAPLVAAIVVLFLCELALVAFSAHADGTALRTLGFPLEIIEDRGVPITGRREAVSIAMFAVVLLQAFALFRLYRVLTCVGRKADVTTVAIGAGAMILASLLAPALSSADMYAYAGDAILGTAAYNPPAHPFHGEYTVISAWWRHHMEATPYGPLWLAYDRTLLSLAPTLLAKIELTRILGAVWFAVTLACASRRVSPATLAVLALNPALLSQFVANGHNDIVAIALIMLGLTVAESMPAVQVALGIAAALVKLPFVLVALVALSGSLRTRLVAAAMLVAGTIAASYLFGGHAYVDALMQHVNDRQNAYGWPHKLVAVAAFLAIGAALLRQAWSRTAAFTFAGLGAVIFPWYAAWGLPYALASRSLAGFLIALPIAGFLFETVLDTRLALAATIFVLCILSIRALSIERAKAATRHSTSPAKS